MNVKAHSTCKVRRRIAPFGSFTRLLDHRSAKHGLHNHAEAAQDMPRTSDVVDRATLASG